MQSLLGALSAPPAPEEVIDHVACRRLNNGVAVVTLWRPEKRNALSLSAWRRLREVFTALAHDADLRVVVVRGGAVFGAGADIEEFPLTRMTAMDAVSYNESIAAALNSVQELPIPVLAMVRGLAVGGGCELAAACDVRVAATGARFGVPIGRLGVTLGYTESRALVRLIGVAQLKRLLFEGELLDADEALRIGLVDICAEDEELEKRTAKMVETISASAPITIRAAKAVAEMSTRPLTAQDSEKLIRFTVEAYPGADLQEGVAAFLDRRQPQFGHDQEEPNHVSP